MSQVEDKKNKKKGRSYLPFSYFRKQMDSLYVGYSLLIMKENARITIC